MKTPFEELTDFFANTGHPQYAAPISPILTLVCPGCYKNNRVPRSLYDPPTVTLILLSCPTCRCPGDLLSRRDREGKEIHHEV